MLSKIPVAVRLSIAYLILGVLWIIFSGRIAEQLAAGDASRMQSIEQYKGIFYVVVSTVFLFFLSKNLYGRMSHSLEEYKAMEKKNDALVTATREGIYEYNIREDRIRFNATMRQILGISNAASVYNARTFWETHIHPDDLQRVLKQFERALKSGINYWREEYRALTIGGEVRNVLHSVYILKDDWGVAYGVIGAIQDLTEFRQLEADFHQQQIRQKLELSRSIIQAEEKERNRWAEELHDNIAQLLSVARLYAGTLKPQPDDLEGSVQKLREMLDLAVNEIRTLSANLKPPRFDEEKLEDAIKLLAAYITRVKKMEIQVQIDSSLDGGLSSEQKLMLYRIVQEQLNNCTKYADASEIQIVASCSDGCVQVTVNDNGKGFDPALLREGTGMRNIRGRLELFQGEVQFESSPGAGCMLKARFPMARKS